MLKYNMIFVALLALAAVQAKADKTITITEPTAPPPTTMSLANCPKPDENLQPEVVVKLTPKLLGITPLNAVAKGRVTFSKPWTINFESGKKEIFFPDNSQCGVYYDPTINGEQTFSDTDPFYVIGVRQEKDRVELVVSGYRESRDSEYAYGFFCLNKKDNTPATLDDFNQTPVAHLSPRLLSMDQ
jgi:hypothetical protein